MIIKSIESKIRLATLVAAGSLLASILITAIVAFSSYQQVANARRSIYILDHNFPISARQTDMEMNRPAEYRGHIELFHSLFFSLTPDDKYIQYQMKKAMYLIDESGMNQMNTLKEKGYFNSILSSSSVLSLETDSVVVDAARKYFRYYGKLKIDRRSATVIRSLITEGHLKDIDRKTDSNPFGVLITGWKTLENKDLDYVEKNTL